MQRTVNVAGWQFTYGELWLVGASAAFVTCWCGALIALACAPVH
jgi:hypothetical protein